MFRNRGWKGNVCVGPKWARTAEVTMTDVWCGSKLEPDRLRRTSHVKIANDGDVGQTAHDRNLLCSGRISTDSMCVSTVVSDGKVRIRLRPYGVITCRERVLRSIGSRGTRLARR